MSFVSVGRSADGACQVGVEGVLRERRRPDGRRLSGQSRLVASQEQDDGWQADEAEHDDHAEEHQAEGLVAEGGEQDRSDGSEADDGQVVNGVDDHAGPDRIRAVGDQARYAAERQDSNDVLQRVEVGEGEEQGGDGDGDRRGPAFEEASLQVAAEQALLDDDSDHAEEDAHQRDRRQGSAGHGVGDGIARRGCSEEQTPDDQRSPGDGDREGGERGELNETDSASRSRHKAESLLDRLRRASGGEQNDGGHAELAR